MNNKFAHIVHGGDYNPDQWIQYPGIWDEDMRLMKEAHINCATVGIFAWSLLEPEEGVYNFGWLDTILDKMVANGIDAILSTPSGARPPWMAEKYPEILRVEETGIRNEYGVRHNHCLSSLKYREKVAEINRKLAERYGGHPALKMWHISNEYSGCCHCELCQNAFREWLKKEYNNNLEALNESWWGGFWSHRFSSWEQISSPKFRGENHVPALKLCWDRFVTDSHISFMENEIVPLRELTPDTPITTNMMNMYDGINYQRMAKYVDIISWDNYPEWGVGKDENVAARTAFVHDVFRSMKNGQPFFMMESTPSCVNWKDVNKLPSPHTQETAAMQAIAHGADSVQYFQWRKSRGGHEKFHGAVVDHCGHENTRVFRQIAHLGANLEKLDVVKDTYCNSRVAIICDWENMLAIKYYCGYNNIHRDYVDECVKWYTPFLKRSVSVDVLPMDADFSRYDIVIAPYLYMLKKGTGKHLAEYVDAGGTLVCGYLTANVNQDDLCYLGGFPGDGLGEVFGVWAEETDSIPENIESYAFYNEKKYRIHHICDLIHTTTSQVLGTYESDFYAGQPSVTRNQYGKGTAYYVAFRNDGSFADDFCDALLEQTEIPPDSSVAFESGLFLRKRGECIFILNFSDSEKSVKTDKTYIDVLTGESVSGTFFVASKGYRIIK